MSDDATGTDQTTNEILAYEISDVLRTVGDDLVEGLYSNKVVERLRIARNAFVGLALMAGRTCAWST